MKLWMVIYDGFYQETVVGWTAEDAIRRLQERDRYYGVKWTKAWAIPALSETPP